MSAPFVLASASEARLKTLRTAGIEPVVIVSGVDEEQLGDLSPVPLAEALGELKCRAVLDHADVPAGALVLGCDSVLELDGEALGKPGSAEVARERWQAMRGRSGVLHTGHALADTATGRVLTRVASTTVHFADVSDAEVDAYVATGEPLWVAGAFTLEGYAAAFISGIEGDPHNVVGVSLPVVRLMVAELGHSWTELWNRG
ncbi:Maf family protein [Nocardioides daphniae]|uniref:Nucleoside triphosphate pyrophosphatase n=1 Tax=Nocardioides daphniae TaxID=402297 RepID=A0A4P7UEM8_9ACTN|nr:nucleoside triphosphate pyrophosphatase [Nocardioides daphniae]QCC77875.1 septum formation inhibitor Maf [Nocardioides daphniae]GGD27501.1 Maf-like protein [Nocardioides daphniae]